MEGRVRKVASRNRAIRSCSECYRRRKKCSQDQPCRNCARRYPPVECVYNITKRTSPQSEIPPLQRPDDAKSNDDSAGPSNISFLATPSLVSSQDHSPLSAESRSLQPRGSQSVVDAKPIPWKEVEEYGFNGPFKNASYRLLSTGVFTINPRVYQTSLLPVRTVTGPQDQPVQSYSDYPILSRSLGNSIVDMLPILAVHPSHSNAELFQIYTQVLFPRVWSIDGLDKCPQPYWDVWIPFTTFSPLILHANLLRASVWRESMKNARTLRIENHVPFTTNAPETLTLMLKTVSLLNSRLRNAQVDDEVITTVAIFFFNEWSYSASYGLQGIEPHVKGLREMLRIRGGLHSLGANGYVAKLVMLCHYHLATVLEREAFIVPPELLQDGLIPGYKIEDPAFESPLFISSRNFTDKAEIAGLLPITALILDRITWVLSQIIGHCYGQNPEFDWSRIQVLVTNLRDWIESLAPASQPNLDSSDDDVYECVRITSLLYCRAIILKQPFSIACHLHEFEELFSAMSRVSLSRWKQLSGIWCWILLAMNPRARNLQDGIQMRTLMKVCAFALAQREWQLLVNIMEAFMALQRWIRETAGESRSNTPVTLTMLLKGDIAESDES